MASSTWRDGRDGTGWRKSSWSEPNNGCCEASLRERGRVLLRDSQNPDRGFLRFDPEEWLSLVARVR
ncbi:DUF397 domain-containing protein [Nocardiopsis sp. NPDC006938]|uniref:DUF397 domain-containing protein n=1 Tax=Nocardiopsis sp. NPDC006938 TaxID=3364337 RepID=UPI00368AE333